MIPNKWLQHGNNDTTPQFSDPQKAPWNPRKHTSGKKELDGPEAIIDLTQSRLIGTIL